MNGKLKVILQNISAAISVKIYNKCFSFGRNVIEITKIWRRYYFVENVDFLLQLTEQIKNKTEDTINYNLRYRLILFFL